MSKALSLKAFIQELEQTVDELSDFAKYDDRFEQFEVAQAVEELNRKAAQLGAPIDKEPVILTPRDGLIQVGKLLVWARQEADVDSKKLDQLLETVKQLASQQVVKEWYTVKEAAEKTGFAEYTLRQRCNLGVFPSEWAEKKRDGKWRISHDAIERIRNEGLPNKG